MSIFAPKIVFNDSTNYDDVQLVVLEMLSYLQAQNGCCGTNTISKALTDVANIQANVPYDKANNTERYQEDVKSSYLLLYSLT